MVAQPVATRNLTTERPFWAGTQHGHSRYLQPMSTFSSHAAPLRLCGVDRPQTDMGRIGISFSNFLCNLYHISSTSANNYEILTDGHGLPVGPVTVHPPPPDRHTQTRGEVLKQISV